MRRASAIVLLALAGVVGEAFAQPGRRPIAPPAGPAPGGVTVSLGTPPSPAPGASATSSGTGGLEPTRDLRAHFATDVATRLVHSPDAQDRMRGMRRAAETGGTDALNLLTTDPASLTRGDSRATLELVRALASFASEARARSSLLALLNLPPSQLLRAPSKGGTDTGDDRDHAARMELARQSAALALAATGDAKAVEELAKIARVSGSGQSAAALALATLPAPSSFSLASSSLVGPATIRLTAELGDLRATEALRVAARSNDAPTRAAALVALGDLGDGRVAPLAREALSDKDPTVRAAATEALVALSAPEATAAVAALVGDDPTALDGIRLAGRASNDAVVKALAARAAATSDPELRAGAISALGRSASREALVALATFLGDPSTQGDATRALSLSPAPGAMAVLEHLAAQRETTRLGVRGYVARRVGRDERSDAVEAILGAMGRSKDPRDRALAIFASVAFGGSLEAALADPDPRVRRAAAIASLGRRDAKDRARLLLEASAKERDPATRVVLAIGLLEGDRGARATTLDLVERVQSAAPDAPLAAMALVGRLPSADDDRVVTLLASRDPVVRAHAARGLAASEGPTASGRLAAAYAYEADGTVRFAIAESLASRNDRDAPIAKKTLTLAARLDPDRATRFVAARALSGGTPPRDVSPNELAWIHLLSQKGVGLPEGMLGAVVRSDGLAVPIAFDEDGYALVPGMPAGEGRLVLAPRVGTYDSSGR